MPAEWSGPALPALGKADREWLESALAGLGPHLGFRVARMSVEVSDDARMSELHVRHLGIAGTTDVLTFACNRPGEPVDADVAVCLDEARRRGSRTRHGARGELLLYLLHGLLHAAGHDDRDDGGFRTMHAEEDRILEAAGLGRIFEEGEP